MFNMLGNKGGQGNTGFTSSSNIGGGTTGQNMTFGTGQGAQPGNSGAGGGMFNFSKPGGTTMGGTTGGNLGSTSTPTFNTGGNTTGGLFGTGGTTTSTSTGMFGSKPLTNTTGTTTSAGTGLFNQGGQTGTTGGIFNTNKPIVPATNTFGMTSNPNLNQSMNIHNIQQRTQNTPTLTLPPTNFLKYEKVESLNEDIKNIIKQIETNFRKNEIYLEQSEGLVKELFENYKIISNEGVKVVKYCKLIHSKKSKIDFILQNLKNDIDQQNEQLEKTRKNFHILKDHPTMKIIVPSEYFLDLMTEIEEKISLQILQISDMEALVNLFYRKQYGSFKINSDLVEETVKSVCNCLVGMVSEAAKLNEYVLALKNNYVEMMKFCYGWKDYEVENRMRQAISITEEEREKISRENKSMIFY